MSAILQLPRKKFTREEVDRMLDQGYFIGQRYELIDGELIDKMGQNAPHASGIRRASGWLASVVGDDRVRVQLPLEAAERDRERSLPEPDVAVINELKPDYDFRHPRGEEALLVIEVSDTTARFDLTRKAVLYARAGVPEYWVVDLNRRLMVVHLQSDGTRYKQIQIYAENDTVSMEGRSEGVKVTDLLPRV
jgi:Uma2 family endonuclease